MGDTKGVRKTKFYQLCYGRERKRERVRDRSCQMSIKQCNYSEMTLSIIGLCRPTRFYTIHIHLLLEVPGHCLIVTYVFTRNISSLEPLGEGDPSYSLGKAS